jgi:hypothetical protein
MSRKLIGRSSGLATRVRVYRIEGALEVDEIDHYEVRRSRVFYDDVVLVTLHRYRGITALAVSAGVIVIMAAIAMAVAIDDPQAGAMMFALLGGPFLLFFLFRLIFPFNEITVFSRRSEARLRFFRSGHARELFQEILTAVREAQRPA